MNIADIGDLSLGQWAARCRQWNEAHSGGEVRAPSEKEFDLAVMEAMGAA